MSELKLKELFHEIKNQISVCDLYTEVIKRTLEKKGIEDETLTRAIKNIKNALELITSTSQEIRNHGNLIKENVFLKELVNSIFASSMAYTERKNIEFINDISNDFEIAVNRLKITSALTNLVKNAVEAISNAGYVKIYDKNGEIFIENNGDVIPKELQEKIFTEGFTTKKNGTGLGIMLTQEALNTQNLKLKLVFSDENKTVFVITNLKF